MLRPLLPRVGNALRIQSRSLHSVPLLRHDFSHGVGEGSEKMISATGFNTAWTQYQKHMVEKLNSIVAGTPEERSPPKDLVITYARDPDNAPLFNYASMAHNNAFFWSTISPTPTAIPTALQTKLESSFSSMETLRREMILTANSMFGPGFVWLVKLKTGDRNFRVLTTYLAGSPYSGAHYRSQSVDMNTQDKTISAVMRRKIAEDPVNSVGAHGKLAQQTRIAPGGIDVLPILCINTWEHVWLETHGVAGKRQFAEKWWDHIDWNVVADYANIRETPLKR